MTLLERIVPHRTRVVVPGRGAGMVVRLENSKRILAGSSRLTIPARAHVILDSGRRVIVAVSTLEPAA